MKKAVLVSALSASLAAALLLPSSGLAATEIGRLAPQGTGLACAANEGHTVSTVASGQPNPWAVPAGGGVITEWKTRAGAGGGTMALQILSQDAANNGTFSVLAESAVETPAASAVDTFKTRLPVKGGELLGLRVASASPDCRYTAPGQGFTEFSKTPAALPNSGPVMYPNGTADLGINVTASIEADKDNDGFGDETQDGCPKKGNRQDDCIKPTVQLDKTPKKKTKKPKAKFKFSSDDAKATFECSVDGKRFKPCASPLRVKKLKPGKHSFAVRATDGNDNTSKEANYRWKVKKKK
jgi:hypothetical protein